MGFDLEVVSWIALALAVLVGLLLVWAIFAIVDSRRDHIYCDVVWDARAHCVRLKILKKYCKYGRRYRFHVYVNKVKIKEEYISSISGGEARVEYELPTARRGDYGDNGAVRAGDKVDVHVEKYAVYDVFKGSDYSRGG